MIKNYIGGAWTSSEAQESAKVFNPVNLEKLEDCPHSTQREVESAIKAASDAFPKWRQTPPQERIQYLFRLKTLMEENFEDLAACITREHGKTLVEAKGSVRRGIQMVETATGIPTLMMGSALEDIAPGIDCQAIRRPLGVFAAICPFNFPAMVPFWFWPFGIATGNTFIVKPSERVPLTQMKVFELIDQLGLPPGVINLVHGSKDVVNQICTHPKIAGVSFVGSTPVAKHVYRTATQEGKRVQSLGGAKNFMVMLPDADVEPSSRVALESIIGCAGERCLAGSVVVSIGDETYRKTADQMTRLASDIRVGDGLDPNTQMGPVISKASKERIIGLIGKAIEDGAELLLDGRKNLEPLGKGCFLRPTVLGNVRPDMEIAKEEIFGPVVCLSKVNHLSEAIEWINSSNYANTCTLFTTSGAAARKFCYEVDPSMIGINIGVPAPMSFFSFGGSKESFFGDIKAHGQACIDFYTDTKTTIVRWHDRSSIW